jgi:glycosyltransferase involved in cell wall biosynthesis
MGLRLAILLSHPIQTYAGWHRELAGRPGIDLRVFFCCDWGLHGYFDPLFQTTVQWDIPLVAGYEHEFLPIRRRPERLDFWQVDNPGVGEALTRFDPHVVKVFGYAHRTNWRVARWTRRHRRPLMLFSDSNVHERPAQWWRRRLKQAVVGYYYRHVDGALCVGTNNRAYHQQYGLPPERLFPGAFPIDAARLRSAVPDPRAARREVRGALGIPEDAFIVTFCGKLSARKRPLDVVAAAWAAHREGLPVWAVLVGEGAERQAIEEFIGRHGVPNVRLTGFVNQSSLPRYFAASDALALPSEREPYGLVVGEAGALGCPAIVSDRVGCVGPGPDDAARPGVNALVYPCGDQQGLRQAVERLCRDRELWARMSAAARAAADRQDAAEAARALETAVRALVRLGPRRPDGRPLLRAS